MGGRLARAVASWAYHDEDPWRSCGTSGCEGPGSRGRHAAACVRQDRRSRERFRKIEFSATPARTAILLLVGIIPFLIAQAFSTVRVVGLVPMSEVALRRGRTFTWTYRGLLLLSGLVLVIGFMIDRDVILVGLAILIATILFMLLGALFVWPTGQLSGDWVRLSFVDERFARALDRWYGDR